eukprot:TRINITY_DN7290_c0_g1_i4.p1 TRINITY_DN7290_c0_g1~~TRINITY_DN7290_c0_g1_i4.p1  ORF type:complete len:649 (+),score=269.69 TRINITY_DN7290_c0_g1_i4:131-2077(+)
MHLVVAAVLLAAATASAAEPATVSASASKGTPELLPWPVIGIDFGNVVSRVGVRTTRDIEFVVNEVGSTTTPSYVSFDADTGKRHAGDAARRSAGVNAGNSVFGIKRLLGVSAEDANVNDDVRKAPFTVVGDANGAAAVRFTVAGEPQDHSVEELAGALLAQLKKSAELALNRSVTHAVIAVPVHFSDAQTQALTAAAGRAGLSVLRLVPEPEAALVAYELDGHTEPRIIAVVSAGGSATEVSLLRVQSGRYETVAERHLPLFGGEDLDWRLQWSLIDRFYARHQLDASQDQAALQRLAQAVRAARAQLSTESEVAVEVESFFGGVTLSETVRREDFERINSDLYAVVQKELTELLASAYLDVTQVAEVVLVGGAAHDPKLQNLFKVFFLNRLATRGISSETAIAHGTAVIAARLSSPPEGLLSTDVYRPSLGFEDADGSMKVVIPKFSPLPIRRSARRLFPSELTNRLMIRLYEGDKPLARDNRFVGHIVVPVAPIGVGNEVEVAFESDEAGNVVVIATEQPGYRANVTIPAAGTVDDESLVRAYDAALEANAAAKVLLAAHRRLDVFTSQAFNLPRPRHLTMDEHEALHATVRATYDWMRENGDNVTTPEQFDVRQAQLELAIQAIFNGTWAKEKEEAARRVHDEL